MVLSKLQSSVKQSLNSFTLYHTAQPSNALHYFVTNYLAQAHHPIPSHTDSDVHPANQNNSSAD